MNDKDFIKDDVETLDLGIFGAPVQPVQEAPKAPVIDEEVLAIDDSAFIPNIAPSIEPVMPTSVEPTFINAVNSSEQVEETLSFNPTTPIEPVFAAEPIMETMTFENVTTPVIEPVKEEPVFVEVKPEQVVVQPQISEEAAMAKIKDVQESVPNKLNDGVLKLEDTLLTNNLKEQIKEVEANPEEEEKKNKKAITFIIAIFVLLGLTIALLPLISSILG